MRHKFIKNFKNWIKNSDFVKFCLIRFFLFEDSCHLRSQAELMHNRRLLLLIQNIRVSLSLRAGHGTGFTYTFRRVKIVHARHVFSANLFSLYL